MFNMTFDGIELLDHRVWVSSTLEYSQIVFKVVAPTSRPPGSV